MPNYVSRPKNMKSLKSELRKVFIHVLVSNILHFPIWCYRGEFFCIVRCCVSKFYLDHLSMKTKFRVYGLWKWIVLAHSTPKLASKVPIYFGEIQVGYVNHKPMQTFFFTNFLMYYYNCHATHICNTQVASTRARPCLALWVGSPPPQEMGTWPNFEQLGQHLGVMDPCLLHKFKGFSPRLLATVVISDCHLFSIMPWGHKYQGWVKRTFQSRWSHGQRFFFFFLFFDFHLSPPGTINMLWVNFKECVHCTG